MWAMFRPNGHRLSSHRANNLKAKTQKSDGGPGPPFCCVHDESAPPFKWGGLRPRGSQGFNPTLSLRTPPGRSPTFRAFWLVQAGDTPFPGDGPDSSSPLIAAPASWLHAQPVFKKEQGR